MIPMLKITVRNEATNTRLVLEGRLSGPWVNELNQCVRGGEHDYHKPIVVDLTDVTFIAPEGEAVLARLWRQGVSLRSTGCFTSSLIEEMAREDHRD